MDSEAKKELNKNLWQAVQKNDVGAVKSCIEAGADVKYNGDRQWDLLLADCVDHSTTEVAELLIDAGADLYNPNYTVTGGLLWNCIESNNFDLMKLMLDAGADPNADCEPTWTVLLAALQNDRIAMIKLLLDFGSDWNVEDQYFESAMTYADSVEAARLILDCPHLTILHLKTCRGLTPLDYAYANNNKPMIKLLTEAEKSGRYHPPSESAEEFWREQEEDTAKIVQMNRRSHMLRKGANEKAQRIMAKKDKELKDANAQFASTEMDLREEVRKMEEQLSQLCSSSSSTSQKHLDTDIQKLKQHLQETNKRLASAKAKGEKIVQHYEERVKTLECRMGGSALSQRATPLQHDTYDLSTGRTGRVVIFANAKFLKLSHRGGVDNDIGLLHSTLGDIGYNVVIFPDLRAKDMQTDLQEIVKGTSPDRFFSIFVIFLSHGSSKGVLGVDGVALPDIDVYTVLGQASNLRGLPKIVIVDACLGSQEVKSDATWSDNIGDPDSYIFPVGRGATGQTAVIATAGGSSQSTSQQVPTVDQDLMVIKPALLEHASKSHPTRGSLFIQVLCEVISQHAKTKDFESMIKLVTERMAQTPKKKGFEACPSTRHNGLTKRFFLIPQSSDPRPTASQTKGSKACSIS